MGHLSYQILGSAVFLPNSMPLLSCQALCPKESLSGAFLSLSRFGLMMQSFFLWLSRLNLIASPNKIDLKVAFGWCDLLVMNCLPSTQCRINKVTNVAIATGPALLGASRSFVLNVLFIICKGGYWNLGKVSEETLYFAHAIQKLYSLRASEIFHFVWEFASAWKSIYIANCLKSFDFKLFLVCTVVEGPLLARLYSRFALFCQICVLLQSVNVALELLISFLT